MNKKGLELVEMVERQLKEIDDCPFISHSVNWLDRLFGQTESDADLLKKIVILRGKITATYLEQYKLSGLQPKRNEDNI